MIATLFSILIAALVLYSSFFGGAVPQSVPWILFAVTSFFLLFVYVLMHVFSWGPIQKVQQNLTPRIFDILKKDRKIHLGGAFLAIIALFSLYLAVDGGLARMLGERVFTALFFILLGISIDTVHHLLVRISNYINPFFVAKECTEEAVKAIVNGNDMELTHWIEAVSEVGINSASRSLPSLCNQAITDLQLIARGYLKASKSIAHTVEKKSEDEKGDPVSFTLFFIFQRFEIIFTKALEAKLEPVVSTLITSLGKIIIDSAKYDMSMATYPIHYLGTIASKAQKGGMEEIAEKAIVTYIEVTKVILRDIDLTYLSVQEPFFTLIGKIEELTKEMFRRNKEINIAILIAPFKQLRSLFEAEKLINHQDSALIINDLSRVINEYEQLQIVLRTIPPIQPVAAKEA